MVSRMQGVSAHIVTLRSDKWLENKTCRFYLDNKHCDRRPKTRCTGATKCVMYQEIKPGQKKKTRDKKTLDSKIMARHKERNRRSRKEQLFFNKKYNKDLSKGQYIRHKTMGIGRIVKNDGLSLKVDFQGEFKNFNTSLLIKKNLIELVK